MDINLSVLVFKSFKSRDYRSYDKFKVGNGLFFIISISLWGIGAYCMGIAGMNWLGGFSRVGGDPVTGGYQLKIKYLNS